MSPLNNLPGRAATMAGAPAISRTASAIHRASVSRTSGPLDAEDSAGIAATPRDAPAPGPRAPPAGRSRARRRTC